MEGTPSHPMVPQRRTGCPLHLTTVATSEWTGAPAEVFAGAAEAQSAHRKCSVRVKSVWFECVCGDVGDRTAPAIGSERNRGIGSKVGYIGKGWA